MGCLFSPLNRGSKDMGDLFSVALLVRRGGPVWVAQSSGWRARTMRGDFLWCLLSLSSGKTDSGHHGAA